MKQSVFQFIEKNRRAISMALVAITLILLLFPWINIFVNLDGKHYDIQDLSPDLKVSQQLRDEVKAYEDGFESVGISFNGSKLITLVRNISDSALSPVETAQTLSAAKSFLDALAKVSSSMSYNNSSEMAIYSQFISGIGTQTFLLWLLIVAQIAACALALWDLKNGTSRYIKIYYIVGLVFFVFFAILTSIVNSKIAGLVSSNPYAFSSSVLRSGNSAAIFHLSFWSFVFLICVAGVFFLQRKKENKGSTDSDGMRTSVEKGPKTEVKTEVKTEEKTEVKTEVKTGPGFSTSGDAFFRVAEDDELSSPEIKSEPEIETKSVSSTAGTGFFQAAGEDDL